MKLISLTHPVQASWLREMSYRMDASPFVSGALEARKTLEALNVRKDELHTLTAGHEGGIFNGPHFSRTYVDAPEHGVPFVGSSDMLSADLSHLPLLRRKDAISSKLAYLELTPGMTLISCSGTIGRTVYSRDEMKGMWSSQHIMKVVPDEEKVPPGYLYAFISCKFGIPIVVSGTYGSIIQSIQPEHIATLPVPRFGRDLEGEVHALIQKAAYERTAAANMIRSAAGSFDSLIRDVDLRRTSPRISIVSSLQLQARMEAGFHDPVVESIRKLISRGSHSTISGLCDRIFLPGIFKRIHIEDEKFGAPYFTGASLYRLEPDAKGILSRKTSLFKDVQLREGTILVQAFGQEGGLTGRPVWVGEFLDGKTTTHMLARLFPISREAAGYLFAFLSSDAGYQQVRVLPFGGSIPHFSEAGIGAVLVPMLDKKERANISATVLRALDARDRALDMELKARQMVEKAIEENA